jgi:integrase
MCSPSSVACPHVKAELLVELRITMALGAYTGMRVGEALSLLWRDVELQGQRPSLRITATVTRAVDATGRRVQIRDEPKTPGSRRRLPITPSLAVQLRSWADEQAQQRLTARQLWRETGLVVTTDVGTLWDPDIAARRCGPSSRPSARPASASTDSDTLPPPSCSRREYRSRSPASCSDTPRLA